MTRVNMRSSQSQVRVISQVTRVKSSHLGEISSQFKSSQKLWLESESVTWLVTTLHKTKAHTWALFLTALVRVVRLPWRTAPSRRQWRCLSRSCPPWCCPPPPADCPRRLLSFLYSCHQNLKKDCNQIIISILRGGGGGGGGESKLKYERKFWAAETVRVQEFG